MPDENLTTLTGSFVGTTNVWDVGELEDIDVTSPEFKELLVRLYQNLNLMSLSLNTRDAGYYDTSQFVSGQLFFPNVAANDIDSNANDFRQAMRLVVDFGTLPNSGSKSVAHGITVSGSTSFTRIFATASDPIGFNYIPIPYASTTLINNVELSVDGTNVTITTGIDRTNFTTFIVVLEYLQF